jgi:hypothetical protein
VEEGQKSDATTPGSTPVADEKEIEAILSQDEAVKADENCATSPNQVSQAENTSVTARQECATEIEEAAEYDVEDPLAMLGGMGEEEVYKVTLIDESPKEESIPVVETLTSNAVEQEEPAECDVKDALAMLGGMGEEEVYKVTLMNESTSLLVETLTSNAVEQEEAAECDVEDPLAMLGGMGEEEVYKITLMDESPQESRSDVVVDSPKEQNKSVVEVEKKKEGASSPKRAKQVAAETESKSKQTARRAKQQENQKSKKR